MFSHTLSPKRSAGGRLLTLSFSTTSSVTFCPVTITTTRPSTTECITTYSESTVTYVTTMTLPCAQCQHTEQTHTLSPTAKYGPGSSGYAAVTAVHPNTATTARSATATYFPAYPSSSLHAGNSSNSSSVLPHFTGGAVGIPRGFGAATLVTGLCLVLALMMR
jgi:hypothetical protein